ncbi:MAG: transcription termination/antitermination protein NusA, partial [Caulobacter sp. 39-67-4]
RRGQNVRLASQLTGWQIDIMTESQESERRQKQFTETTALFQEALDVDEVIAQLLVTEGFAAVEDVAYVEPHEIAAIEGFDDETADELQTRAREFLDKEAAALDAKRVELGVEDSVLEIEGVTLAMAVALGEGDVKTVEDLAGLVPDDMRGWFETKDGARVREPGILESFNLSPEDAEALIMRARIVMGWVEAPPEPEYEEPVYDEAEFEGEAPEAEGEAEVEVEAEEEPAAVEETQEG